MSFYLSLSIKNHHAEVMTSKVNMIMTLFTAFGSNISIYIIMMSSSKACFNKTCTVLM